MTAEKTSLMSLLDSFKDLANRYLDYRFAELEFMKEQCAEGIPEEETEVPIPAADPAPADPAPAPVKGSSFTLKDYAEMMEKRDRDTLKLALRELGIEYREAAKGATLARQLKEYLEGTKRVAQEEPVDASAATGKLTLDKLREVMNAVLETHLAVAEKNNLDKESAEITAKKEIANYVRKHIPAGKELNLANVPGEKIKEILKEVFKKYSKIAENFKG